MKLYILGPMRGYKDFNFPAFDEARDTLESMGHLVVSPADMDRTLDGFDPAKDKPKDSRFYMSRDIPELLKCQGAACLPGWTRSELGLVEAHTAFRCGLKLYEYQPGVGLTREIQECPVVHRDAIPAVQSLLKRLSQADAQPKPTWPIPSIWCCGGACVHLN